jgi:hypothetical protein
VVRYRYVVLVAGAYDVIRKSVGDFPSNFGGWLVVKEFSR